MPAPAGRGNRCAKPGGTISPVAGVKPRVSHGRATPRGRPITRSVNKGEVPPSLDPIRLSPQQRLVAVFAPGLLVLAFGAATYWGTVRERATSQQVNQSHITIETLQRVLKTAVDAETGQRGYLVTSDPAYLEPFQRARGQMDSELTQLRGLTVDDGPVSAARVDSLSTVLDAKFAELTETITLWRAGNRAEAQRVVQAGRGKALMDEARRLAEELGRHEMGELRAQVTDAGRNAKAVALLIVLGAAATAAVSLLLNRVLQRFGDSQEALAGQLREANQQLQEQQSELEVQYEQLQEQSMELEAQTAQLQEQAAELEAQTTQLQEQATELEAQNEALQELANVLEARTYAAEEANRSKARFLAAMSHDLRTPLNAISGYAELMEMGIRGPVTEAQVGDLERIRNSSRHLQSMISGILDFSRIEAGRMEIRIEPVEIAPLMRGIESSFLPQALEKDLRYSCDPGPDGLLVSADPGRAEQVLLNLVGNAIKFTDPGGEIAIRCVDEGDSVAVHISDTGRGIAPAALATIFDPFVQIDREATEERQRGVGLGLAISRELAAAMDGDLTVRSELGRGSVFTFRLPRIPAPIDLRGAPSSSESDLTSAGEAERV